MKTALQSICKNVSQKRKKEKKKYIYIYIYICKNSTYRWRRYQNLDQD